LSLAAPLRWLLEPLASLKLTVVLFAMAIFIVLAGTLAQVEKDIWGVIEEYFRIDFSRVWSREFPWFDVRQFFVWVRGQIFLPPAFFVEGPPELDPRVGLWFPKGWTIGAVMMLNLFAAHLVRFKVRTRGPQLILGWVVIGLGCLITALVVMSGSNPDGLQHESLVSYGLLWRVMQLTLLGLTGLSALFAINSEAEQRSLRWMLFGAAGLFALVELGTFVVGPFNDSAMRILYQLVKGLLAGGVLLAGCVLVFQKRAGIVLLHAGIGLIMVYDVLVGTAHVESRMLIEEGQTVRFSEDIRTVELAVVDRSDAREDWHSVVPAPLLQEGRALSDERLPFDLRVVHYYPNSDLRAVSSLTAEERSDLPNPATHGVGERFVAINARPTAGTDTDGQVDLPSAYVEVINRSTHEPVGTYLISTLLSPPFFTGPPQQVTVDDKAYELSLRFKRLYKPYEVSLVDVQKNDYVGTSNPRDYRSIVRFRDPEQGSEFEQPIWMNNPLRYAGETFYQSNFYPAGALQQGAREATGLQVVSNTGWMIPYIACMIVGVGMLAQFTLTLLRFLNRQNSSFARMRRVQSPDGHFTHVDSEPDIGFSDCPTGGPVRSWVVPLVAVTGTMLVIASVARPRSTPSSQADVSAFARLPVLYQGRPQPFDSLARNALLEISDRQTFKHHVMDRDESSKPASQWLLDVIARPQEADAHQVFRIESLDLVDRLGLERRPGQWRYARAEFSAKWTEMLGEVEAAAKAQEAKQQLTLPQRKLLELQRKLSLYDKMQTAFQDMSELIPTLPDRQQITNNDPQAVQQVMQLRTFLATAAEQIPKFGFPLSVPTHVQREDTSFAALQQADWLPYPLASIYASMDERVGRTVPPAWTALREILQSYRDQDASAFNAKVAEYRSLLSRVSPAELAPPDSRTTVELVRTDFEALFNDVSPFNLASWIYVLAFVLVAVSWLGWRGPLNRAAFWVIATTFVLHTVAVVSRIYISGRPPVTNLYSSAVFIGWAAVLFGIVLEAVYRLGVGNVVAAVSGFLTLRIAHGLAMDGDTFAVLEAVLDTQFWLATHVVCVTLGYAATYVSGLLGVLLILRGTVTPSLSAREESALTRMNYGVLCFALFFSFVGTVLGGLWADDSWGRFWGWDPKENGALIIVLWNALVLHARWDGQIKARGLAVLTVLGNVVVSWSWFGVNELGIGLHSYGFTEGRLAKLGLFCLSQLAIAAVGCLPRRFWLSRLKATAATQSA
jgi:ABC-type transport system involved in cytochrome c biogenesis permease subunit